MSVVYKPGRALPRLHTYVNRVRLSVLAAAGILLFSSIGSQAWAFEVTTTQPHGQSGAIAPIMRLPDESSGDSCLYILRMAREQDQMSSRERDYRQNAGSAAAVGLVFGVRFALGPSEVNKSRRRSHSAAPAFRIWETRDSTGGGQALAIADYRACRNEQALRTLTD